MQNPRAHERARNEVARRDDHHCPVGLRRALPAQPDVQRAAVNLGSVEELRKRGCRLGYPRPGSGKESIIDR
jgi:hypothetical protein